MLMTHRTPSDTGGNRAAFGISACVWAGMADMATPQQTMSPDHEASHGDVRLPGQRAQALH